MTFFLKILNESRSRARLKVNGYSSARFIFEWDGKLRAYKYQPLSQDEVDDLFRTMGRSTSYIFAPVSLEAEKPAAGEGEARFTLEEAAALLAKQQEQGAETETTAAGSEGVTLEATDREALDAKLVEECLHRGIIVTSDDTNEGARRLVDTYDKGAAAALNSLPAVARKPRKPTSPKPE